MPNALTAESTNDLKDRLGFLCNRINALQTQSKHLEDEARLIAEELVCRDQALITSIK
jgi:hypothetical protein